MYKAKHILALALIAMVLLAQAASAASPNLTISQVREEAAAGWHETFEGPHGPVVVDMDITVPEVEKAPVVDVLYIMHERPELMELWPDRVKEESRNDGIIFYHYIETAGQHNPALPPDLDANNVGQDTYTLYADQTDWNVPLAEDNTLTLNEAIAIVQESLVPYNIDDLEFEWEHPRELLRSRYRKGSTSKGIFDGEPLTNEGYLEFFVHQMFAGIPHIKDNVFTFDNASIKQPELYTGDFHLWCHVASESSYWVSGSIGVEVNRPYDDIPLCSLDKVKAAITPLIEKGNIGEVLGLELGYVSYRTGMEPMIPLRNVPTWVLSCRYYPDGKAYTMDYDLSKVHVNGTTQFRYLLVNAQTGELIDPASDAADRTMAPSIIGR